VPPMPPRRRAVELGATRGRAAVINIGRELDDAIRNLGLSYAAIGRDVGLSGWQVARVARGEVANLTIVQASELMAAVGLELSVRAFPTGRPLRDVGHLAILERLRRQLHRDLTWRTEVPVSTGGDLRAWDATISAARWLVAVEAEVRLRDIQALDRRIALKRRDSSIELVILLVANTRHNRMVLASLGDSLAGSFPFPGRRALELLRAGVAPEASAIVVL
jgi:hypothetical protein